MARIREKFSELKRKNEKALIVYIMIGHTSEESTMATIRGLIRGGVDIIELGFPFSDPLADGPMIQNASNQSLKNGMKINKFFKIVKKIRKESDIPLVVMTYTNILFNQRFSNFITKAQEAGIDGCILPDMSIEESKEYVSLSKNHVDTIFLVSPNTSKNRIKRITASSSGFLYLVAIYGTTGIKNKIKNYSLDAIKAVKGLTKDTIPLGVGFGVSTPEDVRKYVNAGADAVIVGSVFLSLIEKTPKKDLEETITKFTEKLKNETKKISLKKLNLNKIKNINR